MNIPEAHERKILSIVWSNYDFKFFTTGLDGILKIWKWINGQWNPIIIKMPKKMEIEPECPAKKSKMENTTTIDAATWSDNDSYIATSGKDGNDFVIRIWDPMNGNCIGILRGHEKKIILIRSNPSDSTFLMSASDDGIVILWNLKDFSLMKKFQNPTKLPLKQKSIMDLTFSSDGSYCIFVDFAGYINFLGIHKNCELSNVPKEQFFNNDSISLRGLSTNSRRNFQSRQLSSNELPYLVDVNGKIYSEFWQKKVFQKNSNENWQMIRKLSKNEISKIEMEQKILKKMLEKSINSLR